MLFVLVQRISRPDSQSKFQMFTLFSGRHIGGSNMAAPSLRAESRKIDGDTARRVGGSILSYIILRGTFPRISQLWDNITHLKLRELSSFKVTSNLRGATLVDIFIC